VYGAWGGDWRGGYRLSSKNVSCGVAGAGMGNVDEEEAAEEDGTAYGLFRLRS
jgi:hypothetical protein